MRKSRGSLIALGRHDSRRIIFLAVIIIAAKLWPFYSVPTESRGVVTQFGKIVGIEQEGLAVLPPGQNLTLFSIRAEEANIDALEMTNQADIVLVACSEVSVIKAGIGVPYVDSQDVLAQAIVDFAMYRAPSDRAM